MNKPRNYYVMMKTFGVMMMMMNSMDMTVHEQANNHFVFSNHRYHIYLDVLLLDHDRQAKIEVQVRLHSNYFSKYILVVIVQCLL